MFQSPSLKLSSSQNLIYIDQLFEAGDLVCSVEMVSIVKVSFAEKKLKQ
jgi:hypothetical protein